MEKDNIQICLNCPLAPRECAYMVISEDVCPIDGGSKRKDIALAKFATARLEAKLSQISEITETNKSLNITKMAERIGVSPSTVYNWKRDGMLLFEPSPTRWNGVNIIGVCNDR